MNETIVIQETDQEVLNVLAIALRLEGFITHPLLNCGENFLELIDQVRPHVVILDYILNGQVCIEVCHKIKEKFPHLPVIALSCNSNIHEEYNQFGFDAYIKKPFDLDLLYRIIRKYIPNPDFI